MFGTVEICRGDLDRGRELFRKFGICFGVGLDDAGVNRRIGVENVELEIDAATFRKREPIRPIVEWSRRGDHFVALVDGYGRCSRRGRPALITLAPTLRLR